MRNIIEDITSAVAVAGFLAITLSLAAAFAG